MKYQDYNQKEVFYQLETTVMMKTIVSTTVGIDPVRMETCLDRDPCQDGNEHAMIKTSELP